MIYRFFAKNTLFFLNVLHLFGLIKKITYFFTQLSRREDWNPINRFNPVTFVCRSQDRTSISNFVSFLCSVNSAKVIAHFADLGGIDYHHCLNFIFIMRIHFHFVYSAQCRNTFMVDIYFNNYVFCTP